MGGLSLIELMVSLVIGLILMIAIVSAYLGSASASKMAEAQGRMNEDAQAALSILGQHIRMAGNNPMQVNYPSTNPTNPIFDTSVAGMSNYAIRGCDNTFAAFTTQADVNSLTCTSSTSAPDSFVVRYEADVYNTVKSGSTPTDCLGQTLTAASPAFTVWDGVTYRAALPSGQPDLVLGAVTPTFYVADNRFYISTLNGVYNLYCKGSGGGGGQPMVENIEDMQILYGTAAATGPALDVRGYLTAAQVDALGTSPADTATRWSRVVTVRVCVVVRSENPVAPNAGSAQYNDCSGNLVTSQTDLRLRRAYTTTVVLRNRVAPA